VGGDTLRILLWILAILAVLNSQNKTGTQAGKGRVGYSVKIATRNITTNPT
jgi:hypothetical protein